MHEPPYAADTRARGWRFELDMEKVKASDTWLRARSGALKGALLLLWSEAWQQTPCGSLPDDDELVALLIDMPPATLAKHRSVLMRGWSRAGDGRLYHETITKRVLAMLEKRDKDTSRKSLFDKKSKAIRTRDGNACVYCAATTYLSIDHLISISRGGGGEDSNLVTACRSCNSIKGARNPDEAQLSFVNKDAERLWHKARASSNALPTRYSEPVTDAERAPDDTKHQAPENQAPEEKHPPTPRKRGKRADALEAWIPPFWVPAKEWRDFEEMRAAMRGVPFTDAARNGVVRKLDVFRALGHDPAVLLADAVTSGHRTVFAPRQSFTNGKAHVNKQEAIEASNRAVGDEWIKETERAH